MQLKRLIVIIAIFGLASAAPVPANVASSVEYEQIASSDDDHLRLLIIIGIVALILNAMRIIYYCRLDDEGGYSEKKVETIVFPSR